jgi:ribosomal protein S27AE
MKRKPETVKKTARRQTLPEQPRCGLCGKTDNLTRTECCGQWICDDEDSYVLFSYARNSCYRNHSRYTLCAHHFNEGHSGDWKTCPQCRKDFAHELEMYVYYGTNEYNFETLQKPPKYKPTYCSRCGAVIVLSEGGYSSGSEGYLCGRCTEAEFGRLRL